LSQGARHAQRIITELSRDDYTRPVRDLAIRVLELVPANRRNRREVNSYRDCLRETFRAVPPR
jgi:hypothetical protein